MRCDAADWTRRTSRRFRHYRSLLPPKPWRRASFATTSACSIALRAACRSEGACSAASDASTSAWSAAAISSVMPISFNVVDRSARRDPLASWSSQPPASTVWAIRPAIHSFNERVPSQWGTWRESRAARIKSCRARTFEMSPSRRTRSCSIASTEENSSRTCWVSVVVVNMAHIMATTCDTSPPADGGQLAPPGAPRPRQELPYRTAGSGTTFTSRSMVWYTRSAIP